MDSKTIMTANGKQARLILISANLVLINLIYMQFLNLKYPYVGVDYNLAIPSILDSVLHFRLNGLSIQWFTPSFGGGIPAFPNPNNAQFSMVVLLAVFLPVWQALILSMVIFVSTGFLACEYFFRRTMNFHWTASLLGAVFFSMNGFMLSRTAIGHLGYTSFPLLPLFLIALLEKSPSRKTSIAILGILIGLLIHFAGYFVLIIFAFSTLISLPLIYIIKPGNIDWGRFFSILCFGSLAGLLISLSKLAAVYSFMQNFPRTASDYYATPFLAGVFGIFLQILGTMGLVPLLLLSHIPPEALPSYMLSATGAEYGLWEIDMSVTPIIFPVLLAGLIVFFYRPGEYINRLFRGSTKFATIFLLAFLWMVVEFILAKGLFYPILKNLPILSSLHVNPRFAASLIFPLVLIAVAVLDKWISSQPSARHASLLLMLNIAAILPVGSYFFYREDLYARTYDIRRGQLADREIKGNRSPEITSVGYTKDNTEAVLTGVSNLNLYEPAFGYGLEYFHPQVKPGSIWQETDGYLNMTNPMGYVFQGDDGLQPFTPFSTKEKKLLELFSKHIQPSWEIPVTQKIFNFVSAVTLLILSSYLGVQIAKAALERRKT